MGAEKESSRFQVGIAACGLLVTAVLGFGQWRLGEKQNQVLQLQRQAEDLRAKDNIEVQVMTLVGPHLSKMRGTAEDAVNSRKVVDAAAKFLRDSYGRPSLGKMYQLIIAEDPLATPEAKIQAEPFAEPSAEGAPWYAVVESMSGDDEHAAQVAANKMRSMALGLGLSEPIELYKTKISNNYAVVIGGKLSKAKALDLAANARGKRLASDAFAQEDRNWKLVGAAPFK